MGDGDEGGCLQSDNVFVVGSAILCLECFVSGQEIVALKI
jgi:hypothetical protein